ncbi:MAG: response regulator [Oligoflexales bacterium]|nr:response regulator [Oligoflexales bacterium]
MAENQNSNLPKKILVVDNDQLVLNTVQQQMKAYSINVVPAKNWETALYLFNQNKFDLCLVSLELEGMTGLTVIQKWREHETLAKRDTAFVLSTGMQRKTQDDALANELEDVVMVSKPITAAVLLSLMATAMKKKEVREKFNHLQHEIIEPLIKQEKFDKAVDIAKTKLEPIGARGKFQSALIHDDVGKSDEALLLLETLTQTEPNNIKYHNEIGRIFLKQGKLEQAQQAYETADKAAPMNIERIAAMAEMYLALKQPDKTVSKYGEMLSVNPEKPEIKFDMYDKLIDSGFEDFAQEFCKQTSTPKELIRHFNNKGVVHSKSSEFEKAIDEYKKALKLLPETGDVYRIIYNMALAHINLKSKENLQKARELLERCLKLQPDFDKAKEKIDLITKHLQSIGSS